MNSLIKCLLALFLFKFGCGGFSLMFLCALMCFGAIELTGTTFGLTLILLNINSYGFFGFIYMLMMYCCICVAIYMHLNDTTSETIKKYLNNTQTYKMIIDTICEREDVKKILKFKNEKLNSYLSQNSVNRMKGVFALLITACDIFLVTLNALWHYIIKTIKGTTYSKYIILITSFMTQIESNIQSFKKSYQNNNMIFASNNELHSNKFTNNSNSNDAEQLEQLNRMGTNIINNLSDNEKEMYELLKGNYMDHIMQNMLYDNTTSKNDKKEQ